jgi:1-deoxy-D-xylulose-5-phosphate reductoisomerase
VGTSTLDVVARHPERFEVFALRPSEGIDVLAAQCLRWRPRVAVVPDDGGAGRRAARRCATPACHRGAVGAQALCELAAHPEVDSVMAAIVGAAGLPPCMAAARAGKRLLLANKEALVVGGRAVHAGGARRRRDAAAHRQRALGDLPVPARGPQHLGAAHRPHRAHRLGGPFRSATRPRCDVTPDEACAHPNWVMGRKISVDSATMMNKALEVIEARWLFDLAPERIRRW